MDVFLLTIGHYGKTHMSCYHDHTPCWLSPPRVWPYLHKHTHAPLPEFTAHLYRLNSRSNRIKLARWNPTFVLFDGGMKWDSINTRSPIGLAGWLPTEAALKRLGAAITQVELQRRWGWGGDDSALITGSEQGVISCGRKREREREEGEGGGGTAARTALMTRLVFWSEELPFQRQGN